MTSGIAKNVLAVARGQAVRLALDPVRQRSRRIVCWTPDFMGFGNVLYLLHWTATQRSHGNRVWTRTTGALAPWLPALPELRDLTLEVRDVRLTDRRVAPWSAAGRMSLSEDLHRGAVPDDRAAPYDDFLRRYLAPGALRHGTAPHPNDRLTVNVRRGDYYSDPDNRRNFGFDIVGYLRATLPAALERDGEVRQIAVISDDAAWCRSHLDFLHGLSPEVHFLNPAPADAFFELAASPRLVMTNSTFSYWAARLGDILQPKDQGQVWAPRFFDRHHDHGHGLVDERWSIVESIPGGWEEKASS